MSIRGLDDYITGKNDPNAPFNQVDWAEKYSHALDKCDWITEAMLEDEETYQRLGELVAEVHQECEQKGKYYTRKDRHDFIKANDQIMSDKLKEKWEAEEAKLKEKYSKPITLTPKQSELLLLLRKDGYKLGKHYQRDDHYWKYYIQKNLRKVANVNRILITKLKEKGLISQHDQITNYGRNCTIKK